MTHTHHRQGSVDSLSRDFVVMMMTARGYNRDGAETKLEQFQRIMARHQPVNGRISGAIGSNTAVFTDKETVVDALVDLAEADLGISVIVTGLLDPVKECCDKAGLKRHTVEHSLGIWGNKEKLPDRELLEFTTMCGHGMISPNLVLRLAKDVERSILTIEEAAAKMGGPCTCGIFNPSRAAELLTQFIASRTRGAIRNMISIDPAKCDKCYACEESCIEAHPATKTATCIVDGSLGPAVSLHCMHCANPACMRVCPTGNIVRDGDSGVVYMKGNKCIGCKMCIIACPFGMCLWDEARSMATKCDLCRDRLLEGKRPACVDGCPTGSLTMADALGVSRRQRLLALETTLATWTGEEIKVSRG